MLIFFFLAFSRWRCKGESAVGASQQSLEQGAGGGEKHPQPNWADSEDRGGAEHHLPRPYLQNFKHLDGHRQSDARCAEKGNRQKCRSLNTGKCPEFSCMAPSGDFLYKVTSGSGNNVVIKSKCMSIDYLIFLFLFFSFRIKKETCLMSKSQAISIRRLKPTALMNEQHV